MNDSQLDEINNRLLKRILSEADQHTLLKLIIEQPQNISVWLTLMQAAWNYRYKSSILDEWTIYYYQALNSNVENWSSQEYAQLHSLAHELYGYDEHYDGEQETAEKLYNIDPNSWISMVTLAEVCRDKERSLKLANKVLKLYPQDGGALYNLAHIYRKLGIRHKDTSLTKQAIEVYRKAIIYLTDETMKNETIRLVEKLSSKSP